MVKKMWEGLDPQVQQALVMAAIAIVALILIAIARGMDEED